MNYGPKLSDIEHAAESLAPHIGHTPMEPSQYLSEVLGAPLYLKMENLQRTGSFKVRGATYRLSRLTPEECARGVVAASAGNHAQGVALAARELGVKATIFMPLGVPVPKLLSTRGYGAEVVLQGETVETPLRLAAEFAERTGAILIHPYDHIDVVTGQATLGLEIFNDMPDVDTVIMGIGGGGLIAGVGSALKQRAAAAGRTIRIIGVQAENAAPYAESLAAGHPISIVSKPTIADGINVSRPGDVPFDIIKDIVDEVVTVSEDDIARAVLVLLERGKVVVEPAGAVGVAAILAGKISPTGKTVSILSGGNIDPLLLQRIVSHGLAASGRYMTIRIALPDRPGQLVRISEIIANAGANVVEVMHTRHGQGMQISEVMIQISVETRGHEHQQVTLQTLREAGYDPHVIAE